MLVFAWPTLYDPGNSKETFPVGLLLTGKFVLPCFNSGKIWVLGPK